MARYYKSYFTNNLVPKVVLVKSIFIKSKTQPKHPMPAPFFHLRTCATHLNDRDGKSFSCRTPLLNTPAMNDTIHNNDTLTAPGNTHISPVIVHNQSPSHFTNLRCMYSQIAPTTADRLEKGINNSS